MVQLQRPAESRISSRDVGRYWAGSEAGTILDHHKISKGSLVDGGASLYFLSNRKDEVRFSLHSALPHIQTPALAQICLTVPLVH